ncbi:MAG TPA: TolC family protein [Vicinamibacterales bacterium]|nr:TolC family protein [Vicinamibacterales bacterium]
MIGRRTLTVIAVTAFLLGDAVVTAAQQAPESPLTLSAAVDLALRNHPAIREARAGSAAAQADIGVARTSYLPRLDFLWQANRATRNNVFGLLLPQPVIPPVSGPVLGNETLDGVWSSAGGLLLSWEAIDFGRRAATVDQARAESTLAESERKVTELDVASAAADAFLQVVAADATLSAARANVQRLEVFANSVRALVQNQLRAGAELSRAEAELAAAKTRLAEAERSAELARVSLAEALGAPGTRVSLDAAALLQVPPPPAGTSFDAASHPRAVAADAQVQAARARDRVLDKSYLPRVELQSAVSGRGVGRSIDGSPNGIALGLQVPNWAVGLSVTFPSLEIFRIQARRRVEASRLEESTARYDRTIQTLQTQEARARAIAAAAFQIAANTPQQLQAARDTDAQARARYDAGLTTVTEVAEAQRLLAEAEAENAVASLAVWRALLAESILKGDVQSFLNQMRASQVPPVK